MTENKWTMDKAHSSIEFGIKHMMISTVRGKFTEFDTVITGDPDESSSIKADFTINVASIDTGNSDRDNHLRSDEIMAMKSHPTIVFRTKTIHGSGEDLEILGDLTIKGITKEITFKGEYSGKIKDPFGNTRFGLSASSSVLRSEFGIKWNMLLEGGGVMLGEKVNLYLQLEAYSTPSPAQSSS